MSNNSLIIIRGAAGAGKTTLASKFAKKHDYALLSQDVFIFDFNPAAEVTRQLIPRDEQIGAINLLAVLENYLQHQLPTVLEGALGTNNYFSFDHVLKLAQKYHYQCTFITLTAPEKIRRARQKERGYLLPLDLDRQLAQQIQTISVSANQIIDTDKIDKNQIVSKIHEIVTTLN